MIPSHLKGRNFKLSLAYLNSVMDKSGGTEADAKTRISKAQSAFNMLKKVWSSREIGTSTKVKGREGDHSSRSLKTTLKCTGHTWKQLERVALDRGDWRVIIGDLCSRRSKGPK